MHRTWQNNWACYTHTLAYVLPDSRKFGDEAVLVKKNWMRTRVFIKIAPVL